MWLCQNVYAHFREPVILSTNSQGGGTRSKHIDVRYHYVRDAVSNQEVSIEYCSTKNMQADALTKPVCAEGIAKFIDDLYMRPHTQSSRRSVENTSRIGSTHATA